VYILFAEDNRAVQLIHKEIFRSLGFRVDIASNGIEAVNLVRDNTKKYDLCVMDVEMPKMNGLEATRIIRKISSYFPILVYSSDDSYESTYYKSGADAFVPKGITPSTLITRIKKLVVKTYKLTKQHNDFTFKEAMPMDRQHAQELKRLKEKGLVKVSFGTNVSDLVLHKNATNKISHDFIAKKQHISIFLNHDEDRPTRCELYKEFCHVTQTYLDEEEYKDESVQEREEMEQYTSRTLTPDDID
jgi:CheY-like chemotaxis protein